MQRGVPCVITWQNVEEEDINCIGFDDIDFAAYCHPPLTTVRVPAYEMSVVAVRILLDLIKGSGDEIQRYVLATEVVVRASCREFR